MNELKVINEQEVLGKQFRVYGTVEQPLFLAKDVAEWIDYALKDKDKGTRNVNMMLQGIDEEEKLMARLFASGQSREMWFLTEDGLYEVLMQSRKPIAKEFKKKVKEILKSIRKHGVYAVDEVLNNPDMLIAALTELKVERAKTKALQADYERMRPKEIFADAVSASDSSILVRDLAKIIKQNGVALGEKRFYKWLRENGYICKHDTSPTQKAMELGLFEVVIRTIERGNGLPLESKTTRVTGKGQQYFINKFLQDNENGQLTLML